MKTFESRSIAKVLVMIVAVVVSITFALGAGAVLDTEDPLGGNSGSGSHIIISERDEINAIDYNELDCAGVVTFDDVPGGSAPGTNYDLVFESNGAAFAERFAGQVLSYSGDFDVLTGTPTNPLTLQVGVPTQNLTIYFTTITNSQVLVGNGPLGYPDYGAIGEGSFAVLFDYDQSEFGFELLGGNDGPAVVDFFRRDGSLIDSIEIPNLSTENYGFQRAGGVADIAGISIQNTDLAGIGFDNLCHDTEGVPGFPPICSAGGPYSGDAGVSVQFDGTNSFDTDGTIVEYEWDFGDGTMGSGATPTHTYAADGDYTVTLCVTDNEGLFSCCSPDLVVPTENTNWSSIKSMYR